jgi:hypothetical protein
MSDVPVLNCRFGSLPFRRSIAVGSRLPVGDLELEVVEVNDPSGRQPPRVGLSISGGALGEVHLADFGDGFDAGDVPPGVAKLALEQLRISVPALIGFVGQSDDEALDMREKITFRDELMLCFDDLATQYARWTGDGRELGEHPGRAMFHAYYPYRIDEIPGRLSAERRAVKDVYGPDEAVEFNDVRYFMRAHTGEGVAVTSGLLDDDMVECFLAGQCPAFADVTNEIAGWPIYGLVAREPLYPNEMLVDGIAPSQFGRGHLLTRTPRRTFFDVGGNVSARQLQLQRPDCKLIELTPAQVAYVMDERNKRYTGFMTAQRDLARSVIDQVFDRAGYRKEAAEARTRNPHLRQLHFPQVVVEQSLPSTGKIGPLPLLGHSKVIGPPAGRRNRVDIAGSTVEEPASIREPSEMPDVTGDIGPASL